METQGSRENQGTKREPYLSIGPNQQALDALEQTAAQLEAVLEQPENWKWAILALHNAVQGFMVLALTGATNWGALRDTDVSAKVQADFDYRNAIAAGDKAAADQANEIMLFGDAELAPFLTLYNRIKSDDWWMRQYINSQSFVPRISDDLCIKNLDSIRDELVHFIPMTRGFLLTQFPAMTETGLFVIDFLVHKSGNILWHRKNELYRFENALASARETLDRINTAYEGLPLPAEGLCGTPVQ